MRSRSELDRAPKEATPDGFSSLDSPLPLPDGAIIYGFQYPHRVGSVCSPPCAQCHETPENLLPATGLHGADITGQAFFIARQATYEDFVQDVRKRGGDPAPPWLAEYCYVVLTD